MDMFSFFKAPHPFCAAYSPAAATPPQPQPILGQHNLQFPETAYAFVVPSLAGFTDFHLAGVCC